MLTAKDPEDETAWAVGLRSLMHTSSIGGSIESDGTALAVMPWSLSSPRAVITVTPLAKWPMTLRKTSQSTDSGATELMPPPGPAAGPARPYRRRTYGR